MKQNTDTLQQRIQQQYDANETVDQFGVSQTPFHTHNGSDSPQINFANLTNRIVTLTAYLPGTIPQSSGNYGTIFTAPYKCIFLGATEVHPVANGSDINVFIEKLTGTTAPGSGVNLTTAANLNGTANTVQTMSLKAIANTNFSLAKGDRLGLSLGGGSLTSITNVLVTYQIAF